MITNDNTKYDDQYVQKQYHKSFSKLLWNPFSSLLDLCVSYQTQQLPLYESAITYEIFIVKWTILVKMKDTH